MMETALYGNHKVIFTIAESSLLLSCKIELFPTVVKSFQLKTIFTKSSILLVGSNPDPPLNTIFGKVIFHFAQATVIQFNLNAIYESSYLYGNCKIIFYWRIQDLNCVLASARIELSVAKVNSFQCKAIATKSSILDTVGVPDPPLITIFCKVIFNLMQATVISFSLITIYRRSYLYGNI